MEEKACPSAARSRRSALRGGPELQAPARPPHPGAHSGTRERQNPPCCAQPALTVKAAAATATRAYSWHRPLQTTRPRPSLPEAGEGPGADSARPPSRPARSRTRAPAGGKRAGQGQAAAAAALTCPRPRAWAAAASLVPVALVRRRRPPPPRSLSLAPPPGLMRDPRFSSGNRRLGQRRSRRCRRCRRRSAAAAV